MALILVICLFLCLNHIEGQRPSFAGTKPIGYPELYDKPATDGLSDRFGEVDGTTQRLPLEANGDRELVDRLSKLPIDKQPFWFINWQALEEHRKKPQTYPQKPNLFIDAPGRGSNSGSSGGSGLKNKNEASSVTFSDPNTGETQMTNNGVKFSPTKGSTTPGSGGNLFINTKGVSPTSINSASTSGQINSSGNQMANKNGATSLHINRSPLGFSGYSNSGQNPSANRKDIGPKVPNDFYDFGMKSDEIDGGDSGDYDYIGGRKITPKPKQRYTNSANDKHSSLLYFI